MAHQLQQPELPPDVEVFGCGVDVLAHVAGSGHLLKVVPAAVGGEERGQEGGEEQRLQHRLALLPLLVGRETRVAAYKHLLQFVWKLNEKDKFLVHFCLQSATTARKNITQLQSSRLDSRIPTLLYESKKILGQKFSISTNISKSILPTCGPFLHG